MVYKKNVYLLCAVIMTNWAWSINYYDTTAQALCRTVFGSSSFHYDRIFSPIFTRNLPEDYFRLLVSDAVEAAGDCVRVEVIDQQPNTVRLYSATGNYIEFEYSLDEAFLIERFLLKNVVLSSVVISSWDEVVDRLESFKGYTAFSIMPFSGTKRTMRSSEMHPLGSGFKLYVLSALADAVQDGRLSWSQEVPITEAYKSLPSGIMHTKPNGSLFSLYDYAEHMIKISDNTATDHLINIVGRSFVEDQVRNLGNAFVDRNMPFLTTSELFKIRWALDAQAINSYIQSGEIVRREMLGNLIKNTALSAVGTNGISMEDPAFVRDIEWFGSTDDLCQVMKALQQKNSPTVLKALSQNTPLVEVGLEHHWKYAGFKGGSEGGVFTATYLLQDHHDRWYAFALAWHNEHSNLNKFIFFDIVQKVLKLIESEG